MKRHLLRICQFSFVVVAILSVVLLTVDGISVAVANGTPREAGHSKSGGHLLGKAKATFSSATARSDRLAKAYGSLPLSFEANEGQTDPSVEFVSHGADYTLFLRRSDAVFEIQKPDDTDALLGKMDPKVRKHFEARKFYHASPRFRQQRKAEIVRVAVVGSNPDLSVRPLDQLSAKSNYFIGNDPDLTGDFCTR